MKAGMFGIIPTQILMDKSLSDGDKIMYAILAVHANLSRRCLQDEEYFAKFRGVEPRTIRSQITTLVNAGYVYRHKVESTTELELAAETMFTEGSQDIVVKTTKSLLSYWNSVLEVEIPYTTNIERLVRRRLQKFSPEQILRALQGRISYMKNTPWWMRPENTGARSRIEPVLEADEAVEKFLGEQIDDWTLVQAKVGPELHKFNNNGQTNREILG